jgi:hypothetical protein
MSNTNRGNDQSNNADLNLFSLPPLPPANVIGNEACATVQIYIGVWDDLTAEQQHGVSVHIARCPDCKVLFNAMRQTNALFANMDASQPSARVDHAVQAAILARRSQQGRSAQQMSGSRARSMKQQEQPMFLAEARKRKERRAFFKYAGGAVAAAAVLAFAGIEINSHFAANNATAFQLPANLTWDTYVLYKKRTMMSTQGKQYTVTCYQDMHDGSMNVETVMPGKMDVVTVTDTKQTLGLDMMSHVAQWHANSWIPNDPEFDVQTLSNDLKSGKAVYLGKGTFQNQSVYRIRTANGQVLLLDMSYMPVNVLENTSSNSEQPMFDTLRWLSPSKVPDSTWDMSVPAGFKMGSLPASPQQV